MCHLRITSPFLPRWLWPGNWLFIFLGALLAGCAGSKTATKQITVTEGALDILVLGDWGKKGWHHQRGVARELAAAAKELNADFIITSGDNFYYKGVRSIRDRHWKASYEHIYHQPSLQKPWYITLGNHDYRGSITALTKYETLSRRWTFPARYYAKQFLINNDTTQQVLILFINSNAFIKGYYTDPSYNENIQTEDSTAQKEWLHQVLSKAPPAIKWKFVVGHHPVTTGGKRIAADETKNMFYSLKPVLEKYGVDAYIAGHDHHLEHTKPAGSTHYFISGSGAACRPAAINPNGGLFTVADQGFLAFSLLQNKMLVQVINDRGKVLYKTEISK